MGGRDEERDGRVRGRERAVEKRRHEGARRKKMWRGRGEEQVYTHAMLATYPAVVSTLAHAPSVSDIDLSCGHACCVLLDADTCVYSVRMQILRVWKHSWLRPMHGRVNLQVPRKCQCEQPHGSGRWRAHRAGHRAAACLQSCGREVHPKTPTAGKVREPGTPWICGRARSCACVVRTLHPTRAIRAVHACRKPQVYGQWQGAFITCVLHADREHFVLLT